MKNILNTFTKTAVITGLALSLTACASTSDRLANIGKVPQMTSIQNPLEQAGYKPVSLPMPSPQTEDTKPNSLWQSSRQTFFKDQRAQDVGDILTILIEIDDKAEIENETSRSRDNSENAGLPNLLGIPGTQLSKVFPETIDPTSLVGMNSTTSNNGKGTVEREEEINLKLAAMITEVLPNGNFVIYGRQEVRVNFEVRELAVTGVIRPEDIAVSNNISYEKIAEARISYGGHGHISDVQQPRYGQQFFDVVFPF